MSTHLTEGIVEFTLEMGQIKASVRPALLTCYGLGSCVGVFLYDRVNKIGGGAHITLPYYTEHDAVSSKLQYADCAIETLLYQMQALGASTMGMRAKLVGGANVANIASLDVGHQNITATRDILSKKGIFIAGSDVGGLIGRKASFNTYTGSIQISNEQLNYTL